MKALVKNDSLNNLNVSNNFIGWNGAAAFAKLLDQSRCPLVKIKKFNAANNFFGKEGGTIFLNMLMTNSQLREVNLASNALTKDCGKIAIEMFKNNNAIKVLSLAWNEFTAADKKELAEIVDEKQKKGGDSNFEVIL